MALVFTCWALAIQTGKLSDNHYQQAMEFIAWSCLLISGLAGLKRMENVPVLFRYFHEQNKDKSIASDLKQTRHTHMTLDKLTREEIPQEDIEKSISLRESRVKQRREMIEDVENKTQIAYSLHKWFFIIGLVSVMLSRGFFYYLETSNIGS